MMTVRDWHSENPRYLGKEVKLRMLVVTIFRGWLLGNAYPTNSLLCPPQHLAEVADNVRFSYEFILDWSVDQAELSSS